MATRGLLTLLYLYIVALQTSPSANCRAPRQLAAGYDHPTLIAQVGQLHVISALAYNPNGSLVVTGGWNGHVCLWDASTGTQIRTMLGHTSTVTSAQFSPDGGAIVTGSMDGSVRAWIAASGRELRRFDARSSVAIVAFNPAAVEVLAGCHNGQLIAWDGKTGRELHRFTAHKGGVHALALTPNGRFVLSGGEDATARLWKLDTEQEVARYVGYTAPVHAVAFSPDLQHILTGSGADRVSTDKIETSDATARLWETLSGKEIRRFDGNAASVGAVGFLPDGHTLVTETADADGTVSIFNADTGDLKLTFKSGGLAEPCMAISPDGQSLLTGGTLDARQWAVSDGRLTQTFKGYMQAPYSLDYTPEFGPDGGLILMGGSGFTSYLWDEHTGKQVRHYIGERAGFVPRSPYMYVVGPSQAVLYRTDQDKPHVTLSGKYGPVTCASCSSDGRYFVAGNDLDVPFPVTDKAVWLWSIPDGRVVRTLEVPKSKVWAVAVAPDGNYVLAGCGSDNPEDTVGGNGNAAYLWNSKTGALVTHIDGFGLPVTAVAFSPDGRLAVTAGNGVHVWDVKTGRSVNSFEARHSGIFSVAFSQDSQSILTGSGDGSVALWQVRTGRLIRSFPQVAGTCVAVALSNNGRVAGSASQDGATWLYSVATGRTLCGLYNLDDGSWVVAASDGRFDTNSLDLITGLSWVMPDDPFMPLSPEVFMRHYYEPHLLPRLLRDESFPTLPALSSLNRVQPAVTIESIAPDGPHTVSVKVRVENRSRQYGDHRYPIWSGAKDIRLFRDGQLVGAYPDNKVGGSFLDGSVPGSDGRFLKRAPTEVRFDYTFSHISMPERTGLKQVSFTAYAFNASNIKSRMCEPVAYSLPPVRGQLKGNAYVLAVDVSRSHNPIWNLPYAASDAHAIYEKLKTALIRTGEFDRVSGLVLGSELTSEGGKNVRTDRATKQDIEKALDVLAGKSIDPTGRLSKVTPDDLVIIFLATHGVNQGSGFYLFPSNIGPTKGKRTPAAWLKQYCIGTDELSYWLRGVDAGDMVMIVDACHSAAATGKDFKPGPMGSRGLGQLAYDKGMRLLASTQADTLAFEVKTIKRGLLTYALVDEGLVEGKAHPRASGQPLTLDRWLSYAVTEVPRLHETVRKRKRLTSLGVPVKVVTQGDEAREPKLLQRPALFDFSSRLKRTRAITLLP